MIRSLHLSSSPAVRAVALLALAAGVAACQSEPEAPPAVSADTWAVVDGRNITRDEVDRTFRRVVDGAATLSEEEALNAKLGILEDLIVQDILVAEAQARQVVVSDADVDQAFNEAKADIPADAFQQELTRRGLTEADMREGLRRELLAQKLVEQEVVNKVVVADQQVTDFFNANREQFNLEEDAFHLGQIIVTPVADPQLANRTGDDATTPQAASAKVKMLMEKLQGGATFAELARDYSEDPESAARGGDLGLVPLSAVKQAPAPLRDAVLNGTVGNARVVSQDGAHTIVYLVAKEPAGQRTLDTPGVREQIRNALRAQKEQLLRNAYLAGLRTDADVTNYLARRIVQGVGELAP